MLARETGLCLTILQSLSRRGGESTTIGALAEELKLSRPYAAKLCRRLRDAGYLDARQGVGGGIALTSRAAERMLYDLAVDLADPFVRGHCVLLRDHCVDDAPCPLHEAWSVLHAQALDTFRACPLATAPTGHSAT